jgi:hypothetical protein
MAKDSDKKAAALEAERTGKLSGLLADEKEFDRRTLWRIGWWGTAAIGTVIVAVLANQGAQSWRRDRLSMAELARQAQLQQSLARDSQNETRRLAAAIETLNNDRDRLYARVTVLEQGLDSVTGALTKQGSAQAAGKSQAATAQAWLPTPAQAATQVASADPQGSPASQPAQTGTSGPAGAISSTSAPAVSQVATTSATGNDKSRADAGKPGSASAATLSAMAAAPAPSDSPSSAASLFAPKSIMASPDPAASKLTGPDKTAKSDASDSSPESKSDAKAESKPDGTPQAEANAGPAEASEAAQVPVQKTEFAVDLGTANSVNGLRALWRGLSKVNSELATLSPIIMVKEGNTGLGMQLRLGAGPLGDAAAAARICASLAERQRTCETTVYDGQRLAARDNEAGSEAGKPAALGQKPAINTNAATGTPPTQRRRVWPQQRHGAVREPQPAAPPPAAAVPPAEPPKPEPNTLSSLFHRSQPQ